MNTPNRNTPPAVHPLPHLSIPDVRTITLSNGIRFSFFSGGFQPICRLTFIFQGGLEAGSSLVPKFTLSQLVEGTSGHSGDEIAEIIDFHGVKIAHRFYDHHSVISFLMLNDTVEQMLPLIKELLTQATFPADRLETAKMRAITTFRTSRTQMPNLASEEMQRLLYGPDHLCGHVDDEDDINAITSQGCAECIHRLLQPDTMNVTLAGQLNPELIDRVSRMLEELVGDGDGYKLNLQPANPVSTPFRKDLEQTQSMQAAVMVAIPTVMRSNPDYNDIRLAVTALGGYFGSRLMKNIREDKGLTYGISAYLNGTLEFSYIGITATCDRSFTDTVLKEINAELDNLISNPPSGEELNRLKLYAQSNLAGLLDTPCDIIDYHIQPLLIGTPPSYFDAQQRAIEALTPERIAQVAAKYITPESAITVIA